MKILIAEDEAELRNSILNFLNHNGFVSESASDYYEAISKVSIYDYDVVVVDINLISGSGLDVIKTIKYQEKKCGIIIISANNSLEDKIKGLDIGADDYITKPFHLTELNSRISAVYRRLKLDGKKTLEFNDIIINTEARIVSVKNNVLSLTRKEYDLLLYFITNKNRVLSKEIIAEHLWGDHIDHVDNFDFIYVHINNLRKKLEHNNVNYINTVYGIGYRFSEQ